MGKETMGKGARGMNQSSGLAASLPTESGSGSVRGCSRSTEKTSCTISSHVITSGPASLKVAPAVSLTSAISRMASATSCTCTGWNLVSPPSKMGTNGSFLDQRANSARRRSSVPAIAAGCTIVALGKAALTAASPAALVCRNFDGLLASAPSADTWIRRSTPSSALTRAIFSAADTCTSSNPKLLVSYSRPIKLMTRFEPAIAARILSSSLMLKSCRMFTCPKSPITFKCWKLFSLHRSGSTTREPIFPSSLTT
mmetsp:Transcript_30677/g.99787  ORF Transcript_30677/g.99787 Transcript_30677/m.99787 type:complete len:255 (+) Transcript_30677:237-1001(+)